METLYPPIMIVSEEEIKSDLRKGPAQWPCSIQLVSWRPLTEKVGILVLRKYNVDSMIAETGCGYNSYVRAPFSILTHFQESLYDYLTSTYKSIYHTKLSATVDGENVTLDSFKKSLEEPFTISVFRLYY